MKVKGTATTGISQSLIPVAPTAHVHQKKERKATISNAISALRPTHTHTRIQTQTKGKKLLNHNKKTAQTEQQ